MNAKSALVLANKRSAKLEAKMDRYLIKKHITKIGNRIKNNKYGEKTMRYHIPLLDEDDSAVIGTVNLLKKKGYEVNVMEAFFDVNDKFLFNYDKRMAYDYPTPDSYGRTGVTIDISWDKVGIGI